MPPEIPSRHSSEIEGEIFLLGVVHGDPWGYERAWTLLNRLQPRIITVEISRYSLVYRRRHTEAWLRQFAAACEQLPADMRRHLALQRLAAQISWPFEARVAAAYAQAAGIPWEPVDLNLIARRHLPLYSRELLTPANLQALLQSPDGNWLADIRQQYRRAARELAQPRATAPLTWSTPAPHQRLREKIMAGRLRRLAKRWGRLVHLGGWEHLRVAPGLQTVASYLRRWHPVRLLLTAATQEQEGPGVETRQQNFPVGLAQPQVTVTRIVP